MKKDGPWTEERTAKLRELWPTGTPAPAIAETLSAMPGPEITRHAVVSKRDRLGLPGRSPEMQSLSSRIGSARVARAPEVPRDLRAGYGLNMKGAKSGGPPAVVFANPGSGFGSPTRAPHKPKAGAFDPLPGSSPVPLRDLAPAACRWPVDVAGAADHMFCGCRAKGAYCKAHRDAEAKRSRAQNSFWVVSPNDLARSLRRYV